ncbi:MAG: GerMN domain-containing protein, partial [Actinomycetota bacterium]
PQKDTSTEVPDGTRLNGVELVGGIATVDVSGDFERAAPPRSQAMRIAQVVYTLTEPENETGIQAVRFQIDGVPQEAIGGEQLGTIPGPVTRGDYERFAPKGRDSTGR